MIRRPPRSTRTDTLFPYTTLFRSKSAAFLLATMNHLLTHPRAEGDDPNQPRAFILAPTRELAVQIHNDAMGLGAQSGLRMTVCYGGAGYEQQRSSIDGGVAILRSEERRVGNECVSTGRARGAPDT